MTSGCLDRKEVRRAIWGVHSTTDQPASGNTGRLFLAFGGPVCADRISNCPLDRVLTSKNLIYLLNLQFSVSWTSEYFMGSLLSIPLHRLELISFLATPDTKCCHGNTFFCFLDLFFVGSLHSKPCMNGAG